jgi:Zn ribbon nucleic-acid-binding protein
MKPTSILPCPRCGGFMTVDGWECDGTLHCVNCGYIAWSLAVLQRPQDSPRGAYPPPKEAWLR